jgi:hypothetical protein
MRFIPGTAGDDRAVLNIRCADANGIAGNIITVAKRLPGSATSQRPSDWWLWGNQHPIDASIRASLRRREQLAPGAGTAPFANAPLSRFETGLNIFVNKDGPHSSGLRAVRVTGPGLPPSGLVYTRPDPTLALSQTWMNVRRKDGNTDPSAATYAGNVGNIFILQRTMGISGSDATTVRPNPNAGNTNNTQYINWAHPLDYGMAPGSTGYIDFSQIKALSLYHFEAFYDGESSARYSFDKTLLTPAVPAANASALQWVDLTAATKGYLDPASTLAASTSSINLAWSANAYAETIASAGVYTGNAGGPVTQGLVGVARGATAAAPIVNGVTVPFPALTGDGTSYRQFQLRYRMLDGSYKDSMAQFN